ncbi:hypothetical protein DSO57_1002882 [Entomophthora muscae]|uniref:Uncharacterized protein n=1 Tax=Entomophthora muscae TaxID=34485 RepID=A0ACC2TW93_9FUNG|nr:hypothetical protein DSO57_1002882 [Entomophthora muscae]
MPRVSNADEQCMMCQQFTGLSLLGAYEIRELWEQRALAAQLPRGAALTKIAGPRSRKRVSKKLLAAPAPREVGVNSTGTLQWACLS